MNSNEYAHTKDYSQIIRFLRDCTYRDVPPDLFDRHLWFYSDVVNLQDRWVYGKRLPRHLGFARCDGPKVLGVALSVLRGRTAYVYWAADDACAVKQVVSDTRQRLHRRRCMIQTIDETIARAISEEIGKPVEPGLTKLYATRPVEMDVGNVIEMSRSHEKLLDAHKPKRWPGYTSFLEHGVRYFGYVQEGRLLSMCGLTQLTSNVSQIIGVETFDKEDRHKGYAQAVCSMALCQGLEMTKIVTWSTHMKNVPSVQTARALGFRPYFAVRSIEA